MENEKIKQQWLENIALTVQSQLVEESYPTVGWTPPRRKMAGD